MTRLYYTVIAIAITGSVARLAVLAVMEERARRKRTREVHQ